MYICDKCGSKISDINEPCPTCGMCMGQNGTINPVNKKFPISLGIIVAFLLITFFIIGLLSNNFFRQMIECNGSDYSFRYNVTLWNEYNDDNYIVLQSVSDENTFIQFKNKTDVLGLDLKNEDNIATLYEMYLYVFNSSEDVNYNNISSSINILDGTSYYYLTADYVSYTSVSNKGKIYIIFNEEGKTLTIILNIGSIDVLDIENDIYDVIKSVEM